MKSLEVIGRGCFRRVVQTWKVREHECLFQLTCGGVDDVRVGLDLSVISSDVGGPGTTSSCHAFACGLWSCE